jgi:hypothetical protein
MIMQHSDGFGLCRHPVPGVLTEYYSRPTLCKREDFITLVSWGQKHTVPPIRSCYTRLPQHAVMFIDKGHEIAAAVVTKFSFVLF